MKRNYSSTSITTLLIKVVVVSFMFYTCSPTEDVDPGNSNTNNPSAGGNSGDSAPDFQLTTLDGNDFKLSDQSDKVVVLFFFGNSCPSCKAVAPTIEEKLNVAYTSKTDYVIVGLDQWDGSSQSVESFKTVTEVTFPLLLNASDVAGQYKTTYDRLVVIDKSGKIVHKGSRSAANEISTVMAAIDDLLKQ